MWGGGGGWRVGGGWGGVTNPLRANLTKWSDTLKQFVGKLATNCLTVFDHFVGLALKGLKSAFIKTKYIILLSCMISEI